MEMRESAGLALVIGVGKNHLTTASTRTRAKPAPVKPGVRAMNKFTRTVLVLLTIGLAFEALRLCFNAFLHHEMSLYAVDPYDFTNSFDRYFFLPLANLLIFTAMALILTLLIKSEFWALMLGLVISQVYLFESVYTGSLFLASFSHSNWYLRFVEWAPILAPATGIVIGCIAAITAKKVWSSGKNRSNKGFNRTPESSGPAKPGESSGGAG